MKKKIRIAILLVLVGALTVLSVFLAIGFDFAKLESQKFERELHTVVGEFTVVDVMLSAFDVKILPAAEGEDCTLLLPVGKSQECYATLTICFIASGFNCLVYSPINSVSDTVMTFSRTRFRSESLPMT